MNKSIALNEFSPNTLLFSISLKEIAADEEAYKRSLKVMESRAHQERRDNEDFARNENNRRVNQQVRRLTQKEKWRDNEMARLLDASITIVCAHAEHRQSELVDVHVDEGTCPICSAGAELTPVTLTRGPSSDVVVKPATTGDAHGSGSDLAGVRGHEQQEGERQAPSFWCPPFKVITELTPRTPCAQKHDRLSAESCRKGVLVSTHLQLIEVAKKRYVRIFSRVEVGGRVNLFSVLKSDG